MADDIRVSSLALEVMGVGSPRLNVSSLALEVMRVFPTDVPPLRTESVNINWYGDLDAWLSHTPPEPGFVPPHADKLNYWLKSDGVVKNTDGTDASNNDEVSEWGNAGFVGGTVNTLAGNRPVFKTGGANGKPYIQINGQGSQSFEDLPLTQPQGVIHLNPMLVFAVVEAQPHSASGQLDMGLLGSTVSDGKSNVYLRNRAGGFLQAGRSNVRVGDPILSPKTALIVSGSGYRMDGGFLGTNAWAQNLARINGELEYSAQSATNLSFYAQSSIQLFRVSAHTNFSFSGRVYEMLIYHGTTAAPLTRSDILEIENYLNKKYAVIPEYVEPPRPTVMPPDMNPVAKYWRFFGVAGNNQAAMAYAEIEYIPETGVAPPIESTSTNFMLTANNGAEKAVDGDPLTHWQIPTGRKVRAYHETVFTEAFRPSKIALTSTVSANHTFPDFAVFFSHDGVTWHLADHFVDKTQAVSSRVEYPLITRDLRPRPNLDVPHRYWRFTSIGNTTAQHNEIAELRLYSRGVDATLSHGGTPTASSQHSSPYPAASAFDHNGGTFWSSAHYQGGRRWLKWDFGDEPQNIDKFMLMSPANFASMPRDWLLEYSDDDVNWVWVASEVMNPEWVASERRTFTIEKLPIEGDE